LWSSDLREHLLGQKVEDKPVAAGERVDKARKFLKASASLQSETRHLQPGDPAFSPLDQLASSSSSSPR
jgi:hypothetical protein